METIEAIVFDLDGTLVNSDAVVLEAFQYALAPYRDDVTVDDLERIRSRPPSQVFEGLVPREKWEETFERLAAYSSAQVDRVAAFEGMKETLEAIRQRKFRLALWTGRDLHSARHILKYNGIHSYFECAVGGCTVEKNKPHPEGLLLVADRMGLNPSSILMVGDHIHDLEGSRGAGAFFGGAAWSPFRSRNYFSETDADWTFASVSDFREWIVRK